MLCCVRSRDDGAWATVQVRVDLSDTRVEGEGYALENSIVEGVGA